MRHSVHRFSAEEWTIAFRIRACQSFQTSHPDITAADLLSSTRYGHSATIQAHNSFQNTCEFMAKAAGFVVYTTTNPASNIGITIQPDFHIPNYRASPEDPPQPYIFDNTICNPTCRSYLDRGQSSSHLGQGKASDVDVKDKKDKYTRALRNIGSDVAFVALSAESLGFIHSDTMNFVTNCAEQASIRTGVAHGHVLHSFLTRLNITLIRSYARQLQAKFQSYLRHSNAAVPNIPVAPDRLISAPEFALQQQSYIATLRYELGERIIPL